ncbi:19816_t:CDS:1, partial [Cetraspora pellucida]
ATEREIEDRMAMLKEKIWLNRQQIKDLDDELKKCRLNKFNKKQAQIKAKLNTRLLYLEIQKQNTNTLK